MTSLVTVTDILQLFFYTLESKYFKNLTMSTNHPLCVYFYNSTTSTTVL